MSERVVKARATVRVKITVEMEADGAWGNDCTVEQVHRQAVEHVENALRRGLTIRGTTIQNNSKTVATVVGTPEVCMTVVNDAEE